MTPDARTVETVEIHLDALGELANPTGNLSTRRMFVRLKDLKTSPPTKEWLEAAILLSIFRKARPMFALASINDRRRLAKSDREKKHCEDFINAVNDYLSPTLLTNHGYIDPDQTFGQVSHEVVWEAVAGHINILETAGLKIFLDSGPLLGLTRDGKLIDHDNDIDLGVLLESKTEATAVKLWDALADKIEKLGLLEERNGRNHGLLRLKPVAGFTVDLFPAWTVKNKVFVFPHTFGELELDDVFPFAKCEITGLNIPAKPEKMLAINYGPGWKEKDPQWKFVRPKGFDSFLSKVQPT
jgi:hypothetical protein